MHSWVMQYVIQLIFPFRVWKDASVYLPVLFSVFTNSSCFACRRKFNLQMKILSCFKAQKRPVLILDELISPFVIIMTYYCVTSLKFFDGYLILKVVPSFVYLNLFAMGFYTHHNHFPGDIHCSGSPPVRRIHLLLWASFSLWRLP